MRHPRLPRAQRHLDAAARGPAAAPTQGLLHPCQALPHTPGAAARRALAAAVQPLCNRLHGWKDSTFATCGDLPVVTLAGRPEVPGCLPTSPAPLLPVPAGAGGAHAGRQAGLPGVSERGRLAPAVRHPTRPPGRAARQLLRGALPHMRWGTGLGSCARSCSSVQTGLQRCTHTVRASRPVKLLQANQSMLQAHPARQQPPSLCSGTEYIRDFEVETVGFKRTGRRCSQVGTAKLLLQPVALAGVVPSNFPTAVHCRSRAARPHCGTTYWIGRMLCPRTSWRCQVRGCDALEIVNTQEKEAGMPGAGLQASHVACNFMLPAMHSCFTLPALPFLQRSTPVRLTWPSAWAPACKSRQASQQHKGGEVEVLDCQTAVALGVADSPICTVDWRHSLLAGPPALPCCSLQSAAQGDAHIQGWQQGGTRPAGDHQPAAHTGGSGGLEGRRDGLLAEQLLLLLLARTLWRLVCAHGTVHSPYPTARQQGGEEWRFCLPRPL